MKIALLGTGFGQAHAAIYAERDVEVVVFGRTRARLEDVQQKFGFSTTADLDGLYEDPSIDLIDVCLPTALHAEHVLHAYTAMIDHVLACLRGEEVNQLAPSTVLDSPRLRLELHEAVTRG